MAILGLLPKKKKKIELWNYEVAYRPTNHVTNKMNKKPTIQHLTLWKVNSGSTFYQGRRDRMPCLAGVTIFPAFRLETGPQAIATAGNDPDLSKSDPEENGQ